MSAAGATHTDTPCALTHQEGQPKDPRSVRSPVPQAPVSSRPAQRRRGHRGWTLTAIRRTDAFTEVHLSCRRSMTRMKPTPVSCRLGEGGSERGEPPPLSLCRWPRGGDAGCSPQLNRPLPHTALSRRRPSISWALPGTVLPGTPRRAPAAAPPATSRPLALCAPASPPVSGAASELFTASHAWGRAASAEGH